jgi:hypothetical protein
MDTNFCGWEKFRETRESGEELPISAGGNVN